MVELNLDKARCGDDGLVALAAALPALTHLRRLDCSRNPATARGWVALVNVLPSLPALQKLSLEEAAGLGSEGVVALTAAVPKCPSLRKLDLTDSEPNVSSVRADRDSVQF